MVHTITHFTLQHVRLWEEFKKGVGSDSRQDKCRKYGKRADCLCSILKSKIFHLSLPFSLKPVKHFQ